MNVNETHGKYMYCHCYLHEYFRDNKVRETMKIRSDLSRAYIISCVLVASFTLPATITVNIFLILETVRVNLNN